MEILDKVIGIFKELSNTEDILSEHELKKDLSLDSLNMVMLLVMIEDTFEIELDESDMDPFKLLTVKDVVDLVLKYMVQKGGEQLCLNQ